MQDAKFPGYFVTRYSVGIEPFLVKELLGVYSACRFRHSGKAINRTVVPWSLSDPSPLTVAPFPCSL